jgi:hypothetical protein
LLPNLPASHFVHDALPFSKAVSPSPQVKQRFNSVVFEKVPMSQSLHAV